LGCRGADYFEHLSVLIFVPVLWYIIGRLMDGHSLIGSFAHGRLFRLAACLALVILSAGVVLFAVSLFLNREFLVARIFALAWPGVGVFALVRCLRSPGVTMRRSTPA